jgi:hypothetical protein
LWIYSWHADIKAATTAAVLVGVISVLYFAMRAKTSSRMAFAVPDHD